MAELQALHCHGNETPMVGVSARGPALRRRLGVPRRARRVSGRTGSSFDASEPWRRTRRKTAPLMRRVVFGLRAARAAVPLAMHGLERLRDIACRRELLRVYLDGHVRSERDGRADLDPIPVAGAHGKRVRQRRSRNDGCAPVSTAKPRLRTSIANPEAINDGRYGRSAQWKSRLIAGTS